MQAIQELLELDHPTHQHHNGNYAPLVQAPARFGNHIPPEAQEALSALPVRSYQPEDYPLLDVWMRSLANFYDGHDEQNKLLDQLVGAEEADPNGFFTKSKALIVSTDIETGRPTGATTINFKRGGAVKIGPVVVDTELRGRGIGKTLFEAADVFAESVGARKIYATTSHLNAPVNSLFERYGFTVEARLPDQYKQGSEELIWGKFVGDHPVEGDHTLTRSVVHSGFGNPVSAISSYTEADREYVTQVNDVYGDWHDDLGDDFIDGMVAGQERGLDFQAKGKAIMISKDSSDRPQGMLTFTPKRGGPVKIYPIAGTPDAQAVLLQAAVDLARDCDNHKLYTFAQATDTAQHAVLIAQGFVSRGVLRSPYKDGHDLVAFDKSVGGEAG